MVEAPHKYFHEKLHETKTANVLCNTRCSIVQKLSNKQSAKVICRFDRLRTAHSKRQQAI